MRAAAQFPERFMLPLVAGGALHVGRPLDLGDIAYVQAVAPGSRVARQITAARQHRAASMWPYAVPTPLDADSVRLAAAFHNVLFLSHPAAARPSVTLGALERLASATRTLLHLPPARSPEALIARHTVLARITEIVRTDVEVRFWAGRRAFHGQIPPRRLTALPALRRVEQRPSQVRWIDTPLLARQVTLLGLLLRRSPLTDLLTPARPEPEFDWLQAAAPLGQPAIARLVAHDYLARGLETVGPPLARAFWHLVARTRVLLRSGAGERVARCRHAIGLAVGMVQYLYAARCMVEAPAVLATPATDWRAVLPSVLVAGDRCGLLAPPERLGDGAVAERMAALVAATAAALGEMVEELTARLARAAGTPDDPPAAADEENDA